MIKHYPVYYLLTTEPPPNLYWNLYWIIRLGLLRSHYWDKIKEWVTKGFFDLLMLTNEKLNFAIVIARYKVLYRIYNKITCNSAIPSTCVWSICLYLATSFPKSYGFQISRKTLSFISKSQHALGTKWYI